MIEPVSDIGTIIKGILQDRDCYIFDDSKAKELRKLAAPMVDTFDTASYKEFMKRLYECFDVSFPDKKFDERILSFLNMLEHCSCDEHSIGEYADRLSLSASRLSHLFREQVGITLKNYLTLHQLERAFQDLLTGKRITEAALDAGFDSPSHFAATVKRLMGLPARNMIKDSEFLKVY